MTVLTTCCCLNVVTTTRGVPLLPVLKKEEGRRGPRELQPSMHSHPSVWLLCISLSSRLQSVLIQKRHPYTGNLNSEAPRDSKKRVSTLRRCFSLSSRM